MTTDRKAIAALVSDLRWQIEQMPRRGIKDSAGNPYIPSYFKRGLKAAIDAGGVAVADYVRAHLGKPPGDGYRKLEAADSLDLACEALVADASKPYAHLFSEADRAAAGARLEPYAEAIAARKAASRARIDAHEAGLPGDLEQLRALAAQEGPAELAAAVNRAILQLDAYDVVAMIRLGRAYEALGTADQAEQTFRDVLTLDPGNTIAARRLREIAHRRAG